MDQRFTIRDELSTAIVIN